MRLPSRRSAHTRALVHGLAAFAVVVLAPLSAEGHFVLDSPPNWMSQDGLGSPQKGPPCGDEGGGTPTGIVTAYQVGSMVTVTVDEKIFHPGHYRIALAQKADRSDIPPEPVVTPGAQACGTAAIMNPPVFPVLADDVFDHTAPFTAPQTTQIMLPAGVTCDHCTLQIIEFMSDHALNVPGGCFYHHCADLKIQTGPVPDAGSSPDGSTGPDSGGGGPDSGGGGPDSGVGTGRPDSSTGPGDDSGAGSPPGLSSTSSSGCACSVPRRASSLSFASLAGLVGIGALIRRRRRRLT